MLGMLAFLKLFFFFFLPPFVPLYLPTSIVSAFTGNTCSLCCHNKVITRGCTSSINMSRTITLFLYSVSTYFPLEHVQ